MGDAKRRKQEIALLKAHGEQRSCAFSEAKSFAEIFVGLRQSADGSNVKTVSTTQVGGKPLGHCIHNAWSTAKKFPAGTVGPAFGWVMSKNLISNDIEVIPHVFNVHYDSMKFFDTTSIPNVPWQTKHIYIWDYGMFRYVVEHQEHDLDSDLPRHLFVRDGAVFSVLDHDSNTGIPKAIRNLKSFGIVDFDWHWKDGREMARANSHGAIHISSSEYRSLCAANDDLFTRVA
ncbi:MAG: hypothetical protein FJ267_06545 [Planctomycetes bacterium]|nr:hypothetical protein [Planctomycetota bacterium]